MNEAYNAAVEVRDAITTAEETLNARLLDVYLMLGNMTAAILAVSSGVRDISDVLHAQYYGEKTREEAAGDDDRS